MSNPFDPKKAKTLQELYEMEQNYLNSIPYAKAEGSEIPYSNQKLSNRQTEITKVMSEHGSNLVPDLAACGALGCLCLTGYVVNKFRNHQPVEYGPKRLPEIIDLTGDDEPSEEYLFENITVKQEPR